MKKALKTFLFNHKRINAYAKKIERAPWTVGRHAFLFILIFILLDIVLGMILFFNYVVLIKYEEPEGLSAPVKLQEATYKSVLDLLHARNVIFDSSSGANYPNPFDSRQ